MGRKPSKKPLPPPSRPSVVAVDKQKAATGQLESAILLWFNEADPVSILVLASNAHDCYHALGKKIGQPSFHGNLMEKQGPSFQERAKYIQDFAKHGPKDLDESARFDTTLADGLMLVSIECHGKIFGKITRLMTLYWLRAFSLHPDWTGQPWESLPQVAIDSGVVQGVGRGTRKECLRRFQAFLDS
jgi:hypothetical protein